MSLLRSYLPIPPQVVQVSGATMQGPFTLATNPTNSLDASTKQYVDSAISGLQPSSTVLSAMAAVAPTANTFLYFTSSSVAASTAITSTAITLLAQADASGMRSTLGLGSWALKSSGTTADITGLDSALASKVPTTTTVSAGNGLSGGGALSGNIALTLGTPSTITGSTLNAVTATSHTHALTLTASDIPNLSAAQITSGTLAVAQGGTGLSSYTAGNILYAATASTLGQYTPAQLLAAIGAASSSITVTAGNGLAGGGNLAANMTISMATPGTLTGATANAATSGGHTHQVSLTTSDIAGLSDSVNSTSSSGLTTLGGVRYTDLNTVAGSATTFFSIPSSGTNVPSGFSAMGGIWLPFDAYNGGEMVIDKTGRAAVRGLAGSSTVTPVWTSWYEVWTSNNFNPSNKLDTVNFTWANLGGKPTTVSGFGLTNAVTTDTAQSISGVKTFSGAPVFTTGTIANNASAPILSAYTDNVSGSASILVLRGGASSLTGWVFRTANSGTTTIDSLVLNPDGSAVFGAALTVTGLLTASGGLTGVGVTSSNSIFSGMAGGVILAGSASGGTVYLRPNGGSSTTGQMVVSASGNVSTVGTLTSGGDLVSATGYVVLEGTTGFNLKYDGTAATTTSGVANTYYPVATVSVVTAVPTSVGDTKNGHIFLVV